jgi:acyl-CoA hydrolase
MTDMATSTLADCLRPGDRVLIGQACGEPVGLVADLFEQAARLGHLNVFCGYSLNPAWENQVPDSLHVTTYCGLGTMGKLLARQGARLVPSSLSQLSAQLRSRKLAVDVVLLQVSPADAEGYHSLGCAVDYAWDAVQVARQVVVEVNLNMPTTRGAPRLHSSKVLVARQSNAPLLESLVEEPGDLQRQLARHVASLVPDGATLQLGIGSLARAIAEELQSRRGLKVRSGMVGDWFLSLLASGAIDTGAPNACLGSLAVGSQHLYNTLSCDSLLGFAQPALLAQPIAGSPMMAINSAIEVDLSGQVNAEWLGERYVGAVGGQTDYFRAARASAGGLAILALTSSTGRGASRIIQHCNRVTSTYCDVDVIVTEHGVADIRATTLQERCQLIAAIASPEHRDALLQSGQK